MGACPRRQSVPAASAVRTEAVLLQQKPNHSAEPVGAPAPGANGACPGANTCPLRSRFAPRRCSYNKTKPCQRTRRSTRPGCEWGLPGVLICAGSGSHRGGAPTTKPKTACEPVGAPAPGANGFLPAPYPVIGKPGPFHKLGVPDISTIQQQRDRK